MTARCCMQKLKSHICRLLIAIKPIFFWKFSPERCQKKTRMNPRGRLRLRRRQYWPSQSLYQHNILVHFINHVSNMYPTCTWYVPVLCNLDHVINAISLFRTSFFSFLRLEFHFVAPKSAQNKKAVGRMYAQILTWSGASGNHSEDPKRLPVTARSSQNVSRNDIQINIRSPLIEHLRHSSRWTCSATVWGHSQRSACGAIKFWTAKTKTKKWDWQNWKCCWIMQDPNGPPVDKTIMVLWCF